MAEKKNTLVKQDPYSIWPTLLATFCQTSLLHKCHKFGDYQKRCGKWL